MSDGARILDRGYRPYDGPRTGLSGAMRAVVVHSLGRVIGIRRGASAKVLPILVLVISVLPAAVFVGMAALLPRSLVEEGTLPAFGEYYGYITSAIVIFAAFVAPELLCTDRRTRMLGLLLASPLDRTTYLVSKAIAVLVALAIITIGPPLLMLVAFTLEGAGPDGVDGWVTMFARILLSGVAVAVLHTTLSLAVSSFTDRNSFATAGVLLLMLASAAVSGVLMDTGAADEVALLDLLNLPFDLVTRIHPDVEVSRPGVSTGLVAAAYVGWTLVFTAVVAIRYRRLEVTR